MGLQDYRQNYKPFEYQEPLDFISRINKTYWIHDEVKFDGDLQDYHNYLTESQRTYNKRSMLMVSTVEVAVKLFWGGLYNMFPKPEINGLGVTFAEDEFRHAEAYSRLGDVVGYNDELEHIMKVPAVKAMMDFLNIELRSDDPFTKIGLFGLLVENGLLFESFATIYSNTRFKGLMKNVSNMVAWTSVDEQCFPLNTRVLTPRGWRFISDMEVGDDIYGFIEGKLNKESVVKTIRKPFKGRLITTGNSRHSISTTPEHDMIYVKDGEWLKGKASEVKYNNHMKVPVTVEYNQVSHFNLLPCDRLKIAIQADGTLLKWRNTDGEVLDRGKEGGANYSISLRKKRKIERLTDILTDAGIKYNLRVDDKGYHVFSFNFEYGSNYKEFDWIYRTNILNSKQSCEMFINEVLKWDGYISDNEKCYTSTNIKAIEVVEQAAILAGYRTSIYENSDSDRSDNFNNSYKLNISSKDNKLVHGWSYCTDDSYEYEDDVVCVTVPSGGIIVKQGLKSPFITGNCHADAATWLLNTLSSEQPLSLSEKSVKEEEFKRVILRFMELQKDVRDWIFEQGECDHFTKTNLENFTKRRIDDALANIGFSRIFNITDEEYEPMEWFDEEIFANTLDDFFAKRPVDYTKHDKPVTGDDIF